MSEPPTWPVDLPSPAEAARGMNAMAVDSLVAKMGITYVHVSPDLVTATMPVAGNTQPYGLLHGGASAVLAETVGSVAAAMHAGPDRIVMGIELNATHHRGAREGHVHAAATPLSRGRTLASYEIKITDDAGRPVCTARLTCLLRDA